MAICNDRNNYTGTRRGNRETVTPIKGSVMKNKKHFHYKIYSFNVIPQIWADKIIINLTIRASCAPRIIYPAISKLFPEDIFGTL